MCTPGTTTEYRSFPATKFEAKVYSHLNSCFELSSRKQGNKQDPKAKDEVFIIAKCSICAPATSGTFCCCCHPPQQNLFPCFPMHNDCWPSHGPDCFPFQKLGRSFFNEIILKTRESLENILMTETRSLLKAMITKFIKYLIIGREN